MKVLRSSLREWASLVLHLKRSTNQQTSFIVQLSKSKDVASDLRVSLAGVKTREELLASQYVGLISHQTRPLNCCHRVNFLENELAKAQAAQNNVCREMQNELRDISASAGKAEERSRNLEQEIKKNLSEIEATKSMCLSSENECVLAR